jgi:hypothetical protein
MNVTKGLFWKHSMTRSGGQGKIMRINMINVHMHENVIMKPILLLSKNIFKT